ncbi:hypothetical protein I12128_10220 [Campylobacter jejuni]|nr:hypothetical protein I12128_10220 [Campylobacter jejuni]
MYHLDEQKCIKEFMNLDEETQRAFVAWMDIEKQISKFIKAFGTDVWKRIFK